MIGLRGTRQELRHLINLTVQVKGNRIHFRFSTEYANPLV
jgi:hypothetical protein